MNDVFIARQPIFDRKLDVYGYELLFRHADSPRANVIDADQATSQVIINAFTVIGFDELVDGRLAFINMTRGFLLRKPHIPFPVDRVVFEVLEDIEPDEELLAALRELSRRGYAISLDDFVFKDALLPLVELADIIKVDLAALTSEQLREHVARLRSYKVRLLAEKVETAEQFELCRELGFDYFQGYFLERPQIVRAASIPTNRLPVVQLLTALHAPDIDVDELERIISSDVTLCYKLLRYLNSPLYPLRRSIDSIRQAIVYVGINELRVWASMLALGAASGKPRELVLTLMERGRMCERLARRLGLDDPYVYFTIGMFSGLDSLLDAPMEAVLASLPLSDEINAALLRREGVGGRLLDAVLNYERGNWGELAAAEISAADLAESYLDAIRWSKELRRNW